MGSNLKNLDCGLPCDHLLLLAVLDSSHWKYQTSNFLDVRFSMFYLTSVHLHQKPNIKMDKVGRFWLG